MPFSGDLEVGVFVDISGYNEDCDPWSLTPNVNGYEDAVSYLQSLQRSCLSHPKDLPSHETCERLYPLLDTLYAMDVPIFSLMIGPNGGLVLQCGNGLEGLLISFHEEAGVFLLCVTSRGKALNLAEVSAEAFEVTLKYALKKFPQLTGKS